MFKNRTAIITILAAFFPAVISISGILAHAQGRLEAQYGITMAGLPIGNIVWHVEIGNNFYATSANGKASRVLGVLISGEGSVTTSGKIENAQMAPTYFSSSFFDEDGKTELQVIFAAGISKELIIQEPLKKHKLIPLDDVDRRGVTDPCIKQTRRYKSNAKGPGSKTWPSLLRNFGSVSSTIWKHLDRIDHCHVPNKVGGACSFQFGRASAPIAPQTVQTMRGQNDGTVTSSGKPLTFKTA